MMCLRGASLQLLCVLAMIICFVQGRNGSPSAPARGPTASKMRNFYDFKAKTIDGLEMELDEFRGQVLLVVNVASQCGFTDAHYKSMSRLHKGLAPTGRFNILAFPCNQFGNQEPDNNPEILAFAKDTYGVEFPLFVKSNVQEPNANQIFKYLADITGKIPNWNFWKYLIDHKGNVVGAYGPWTDVEELTTIIRSLVDKAVKADPGPNKEASGPPQRAHDDYGDGAGGGLDVWSEAMPSAKPQDDDRRQVDRAGTNPNASPSEGTNRTPAKEPAPLKPPTGSAVPIKPAMGPGRHDDL